MGVYYFIFNLDKKEYFTGHELGNCIKWRSTFYGNVPLVLTALLRHGERWAGDRIEIIGDDSNPERFEELMKESKESEELQKEINSIVEELKEEKEWKC